MKTTLASLSFAFLAGPLSAQTLTPCPDFTKHEIYNCRNFDKSQQPKDRLVFTISIRQGTVDGVPSFIVTGASSQTFVANGQPMTVQAGSIKATATATCEDRRFVTRTSMNDGQILVDKFYIERKGLVRMSYVNKGQGEEFAGKTVCQPYYPNPEPKAQ